MDATKASSVCSQHSVQELAKAGLSHRAAELFDWMRRLPDGHELASLCDVYTYTTGKHISWSHEWLQQSGGLQAVASPGALVCHTASTEATGIRPLDL